MKTIFTSTAAAAMLIVSGLAQAMPVEIVTQQDTWNYNTTTVDLFSGFTSLGFSDFTDNYTGANTGQAAFGNSSSGVPAPNTTWAANTDLTLQTTATLSGSIIGDVTLNLAVDNGAIVFINGTKVFAESAGGFTSIWEYTQLIDGSLFNVGLNTISVMAEDHGGATYFDMQLIALDGVSAAVSEPSTLALLGLGLIGAGLGKRKRV